MTCLAKWLRVRGRGLGASCHGPAGQPRVRIVVGGNHAIIQLEPCDWLNSCAVLLWWSRLWCCGNCGGDGGRSGGGGCVGGAGRWWVICLGVVGGVFLLLHLYLYAFVQLLDTVFHLYVQGHVQGITSLTGKYWTPHTLLNHSHPPFPIIYITSWALKTSIFSPPSLI